MTSRSTVLAGRGRVASAGLVAALLAATPMAEPTPPAAGFPNDHLLAADAAVATRKVREVAEADRIQRALWRIGRGKTLYIRGGHYRLDRTLDLYGKTNVRIAGYPGERVVLDWTRAAEANPGLHGLIVRQSRNVTIENLELVGTSDEALSSERTRGLTVRHCRIHHCGTGSQNAWSIGGSDVLGEHNLFYGTSSHVIYIQASNVVLRNNVILMSRGPGGYGIQVGTDVAPGGPPWSNILIYNNLIGEIRTRAGIVNWGPTRNVRIFNNVFYRCAQGAALLYFGDRHAKQGWVIRNNVVWESPAVVAEVEGEVPGVTIADNVLVADAPPPFRDLRSSEEAWAALDASIDAHLGDLRPAPEAAEWLVGRGVDPASMMEGIDLGKFRVPALDRDLSGSSRPADRFDVGPYVVTRPEDAAADR